MTKLHIIHRSAMTQMRIRSGKTIKNAGRTAKVRPAAIVFGRGRRHLQLKLNWHLTPLSVSPALRMNVPPSPIMLPVGDSALHVMSVAE